MKNSKESFCHTCRRQRLRCDATKPTCNKCATRGVECLGYGAQPILWVLPQTHAPAGLRHETHDRVDDSSTSSNSSSSSQDLATGETTGKKRGRPRLVLMSERAKAKPTDNQIQLRQHTLKSKTPGTIWLSPTRNLNPVGYEADRLTIHCIQYYNDYICPDLALMDNPANPHRLPMEYWVYLPEMMIDMVISAALTTQVIRSNAGQGLLTYTAKGDSKDLKRHHLGAVNHPSLPTIYKHQRNALKSLNTELSSPQAKYNDIVLSLVITLMRSEIQQSAFGAWPVHLEAARTIIAHRGGFTALAEAGRGYLDFILSEFMLIDVMSTTMTPTDLLDAKPVKQLEYIPQLPIMYKDGLTSGFPCPSELIECLIRINYARYLNSASFPDQSHVDRLAEELIQKIFSFCPKAWADNQYSNHTQRLPGSSPSDVTTMNGEDAPSTCAAHATPTLPGAPSSSATSASWVGDLKKSWEDLTLAFQASVLLYCLQTLFLFRRPQPRIPAITAQLNTGHLSSSAITDAESLRDHTLKSLLGAIHRLWSVEAKDPTTWCGKFLMWPMFVAGMELDSHPELPGERQFLCSSLTKLCEHLGDLSPLDAAAMLGATYARSKRAAATGCVKYGPWVDRVSWTGVRGLFFL